MKSLLTVYLTFSIVTCFAQSSQSGSQVGQTQVLQSFQNVTNNAGVNSNLIEGSPYSDDVFFMSNIAGLDKIFLSRYNAVQDQFEIKEEEKTFILPKKSEYNTITIGKLKYVLLDYNEEEISKNGYLIELVRKGDVALFKKNRIKITEKKEASGYAKATPAQYIKVSPEFYLQIKTDAIHYFPKNKKTLLNLFPESKDKIEGYLKENKTSFKSDEDLIKLTEFLSSL